MTEKRMKELINELIDEMISNASYDILFVIKKLLGLGFTKDELINEFEFAEGDVEMVLKEVEK